MQNSKASNKEKINASFSQTSNKSVMNKSYQHFMKHQNNIKDANSRQKSIENVK